MKPPPIAYSQRIRLEWLEAAAGSLLMGDPEASIRAAVGDLIGHELSVGSTAKKGNRQKATCIVMRTWVNVPKQAEPLRAQALALWPSATSRDRLLFHWGMMMAAYPFFTAVATHAGRLLRLQRRIHQQHVVRRIQEQYGDRETVVRATERLLRNFADWGVLEHCGLGRSEFHPAETMPVSHHDKAAWLLEAAFVALSGTAQTLSSLSSSPALFPFHIEAPPAEAFQHRAQALRNGPGELLLTGVGG